MNITHVVVDGSNIATEGREAPSLAQLDEAVEAFAEEYSPEIVTVVVDATFPNRIAANERKAYEAKVAANELITPPAGAIGRGDGFVLQIARRAQAAILSNDSFQEFHGQYPWLFEKGRLIGGKPVPHVGWVFMERAPVRGPTSRRAISEARKEARAGKATTAIESAVEVAPDEGVVAPTPPAAPARRSRRKAPAKEAAVDTAVAAGTVSGNGVSADAAPTPAEAVGGGARRRGKAAPADTTEAHNDLLPFLDFVQAHPVGSEVDATIEKFSSHGAYALVGDVRAYVPLRNLADPPPRSAKEVVALGEVRSLVVVAIDPPRRGIDMGIPGVAAPEAPPPATSALLEEAKAAAGVDAEPAPAEPAPAPAKRTRRSRKAAAPEASLASAARGDGAPAGPEGAEAPAAPEGAGPAEPAPAKRTRRSRKAAAPVSDPAALAGTGPPDSGADAPAVPSPSAGGPDEPGDERGVTPPGPAKRSRKRAAAKVDPAAGGEGDRAGAAEAPAPVTRSRKRAAVATDPAGDGSGEGAPEAPAPAKRSRKRVATAGDPAAADAAAGDAAAGGAGDSPGAAEAPATVKRSRKRVATPAAAEPGGDGGAAAEPPAPAKRSRKRVAAVPEEGTGTGEPAPARAAARTRKAASRARTTADGATDAGPGGVAS
jgi:hypothetical protein